MSSYDPSDMPVSLEKFRNNTHHEEIVDKILKTKAHGDSEKLQKLRNSQKMKDKVLRNYYYAFYTRPKFRQDHPIRFKPMTEEQKSIFLKYARDIKSNNDEKDEREDERVAKSVIPSGVNHLSDKKSFGSGMKKDQNDEIMTENDNEAEKRNNQNNKNKTTDDNTNFNTATVAEANLKSAVIIQNNVNTLYCSENLVKYKTAQCTEIRQNKNEEQLKNINMPVSLELFKQYTYYEDIVEKILKSKAHGNIEKLEKFENSQRMKDKVLQKYYTTFYTCPKFRQDHPIKFKPMPKKQKEMFLQYAKFDSVEEVPEKYEESENARLNIDVGSKPKNCNIKTFNLMKQFERCDEHMPEDDNDLLTDDEVPCTSKRQLSTTAAGANFDYKKQHFTEKTSNNSNCEALNILISDTNQMEYSDSKISDKINNNSEIVAFNFNPNAKSTGTNTALSQIVKFQGHQRNENDKEIYDNDMPVSLELFMKFTYYEEMVEKILKSKAHGNLEKLEKFKNSQRMKEKVLHKYYTAFYTRPKFRQDHPIRFKPMPKHQRETFLQYAKGVENIKEIENINDKLNSDSKSQVDKEINNEKEGDKNLIILSKDGDTGVRDNNDEVTENDIETKTETNFIKQRKRSADESSEDGQPPHKYSKCDKTIKHFDALEMDKKYNNNNSDDIIKNVALDNKNTGHNTDDPKNIQLKGIQMDQINYKDMPVSLDQFMKYTYYDEMVEKILKSKAHGNVEKYQKFRNSQKMREKVLQKYYITFYTCPKFRQDHPIRFKPMPKHQRDTFLKYAKGVEDIIEIGNANNCIGSNDTKTAENNSIDFPATSIKNIDDINNDSIPPNINDKNEVINKCYTITKTLDKRKKEKEEINMPQTFSPKSTSYFSTHISELIKFVHYCPLTFFEFKENTNLMQLVHKMCEKKFGNAKTRAIYWAKRIYLNYYINPEYRRMDENMIRLNILPHCTQDIKKKFYEIPIIKEFNENENKYKKNKELQKIKENDKFNENEKVKEYQNITGKENARESKDREKYNETQKLKKDEDIKEPQKISEKEKVKEIVQINDLNREINSEALNKDTSCKFCQIPFEDFVKNSNVTTVETTDMDIRKIYISFMEMDENIFNIITAKAALVANLYKYSNVCAVCEQKWRTSPLNNNQTEENNSINIPNANDIQIISDLILNSFDNPNKELMNENSNPIHEPESKDMESHHNPENIINSVDIPIKEHMNSNPTYEPDGKVREYQQTSENNKNRSQISELAKESGIGSVEGPIEVIEKEYKKASPPKAIANSETLSDVIEFSVEDDLRIIFSKKEFLDKFSIELCKALRVPLNCSELPFTLEEFKKFCLYHEPLKQILNDFCGTNKNAVEKFLQNSKIYKSLLSYYYYNLCTNSNFLKKYPVKLKEKRNVDIDCKIRNFLEGREDRHLNISNLNKYEDDTSLSKSDLYWLNKIKNMFNMPIKRTQKFGYILRTTFGLKQEIFQILAHISFEEFQALTYLFDENQQLAIQDESIWVYLYDCVQKFSIWPQDLYIKIEDLFLKLKQEYPIVFRDLSKKLSLCLAYVSPKFLHWSDLIMATNYFECVCLDYEQRTAGDLLHNSSLLEEECKKYYNHCWSEDKWIGDVTPEIKTQILEILQEAEDDDIHIPEKMEELHIVSLKPQEDIILQETEDNELNPEADSSNLNDHIDVGIQANLLPQNQNLNILTNTDENISTSNPLTEKCQETQDVPINDNEHDSSNYFAIPSTQDQMGNLPMESISIDIAKDPLESTMVSEEDVNLNESAEIISLIEKDEIKLEPESIPPPLNGLQFIEDSNEQMLCHPIEEEIIDLDLSIVMDNNSENLPSSQIVFDDDYNNMIANPCSISVTNHSGNILSSGSSSSTFHCGQPLPNDHSKIDDESQLGNVEKMPSIPGTEFDEFAIINSGGEHEEEQCAIEDIIIDESHLISEQNSSELLSQLTQCALNEFSDEGTINSIHHVGNNESSNTFAGNKNNFPSDTAHVQHVQYISGTLAPTLPPFDRIFAVSSNSVVIQNVSNCNENFAILPNASNAQIIQNVQYITNPTSIAASLPMVRINADGWKSNAQLKSNANQKFIQELQQVSKPEAAMKTNPSVVLKKANLKKRNPTKTVKAQSKNKDVNIQTDDGYVPQLTHIIRPLPLKTVGSSTGKKEQAIPKDFQPPLTSSQNSQSIQISNTTSQASSENTIRVSQELAKDSTIFNNTSLLRVADQIPTHQTASTSNATTALIPTKSTILIQKQKSNAINKL